MGLFDLLLGFCWDSDLYSFNCDVLFIACSEVSCKLIRCRLFNLFKNEIHFIQSAVHLRKLGHPVPGAIGGDITLLTRGFRPTTSRSRGPHPNTLSSTLRSLNSYNCPDKISAKFLGHTNMLGDN